MSKSIFYLQRNKIIPRTKKNYTIVKDYINHPTLSLNYTVLSLIDYLRQKKKSLIDFYKKY
jgi:hypothetical protein